MAHHPPYASAGFFGWADGLNQARSIGLRNDELTPIPAFFSTDFSLPNPRIDAEHATPGRKRSASATPGRKIVSCPLFAGRGDRNKSLVRAASLAP
jgi:hypothetical protein